MLSLARCQNWPKEQPTSSSPHHQHVLHALFSLTASQFQILGWLSLTRAETHLSKKWMTESPCALKLALVAYNVRIVKLLPGRKLRLWRGRNSYSRLRIFRGRSWRRPRWRWVWAAGVVTHLARAKMRRWGGCSRLATGTATDTSTGRSHAVIDRNNERRISLLISYPIEASATWNIG